MADCVIVDSPPLSVCSDGFMLATLTDGVAMVINAKNWKGEPELKWKQRLEESGAVVLGVILNQVERGEDAASYYSYYNKYYYYGGNYGYNSYWVNRRKQNKEESPGCASFISSLGSSMAVRSSIPSSRPPINNNRVTR